jgi:lysophospholipase
MRELLGRMNITGFDTNEYFDRYSGNTSILPTIGIAISGGGYRAMLLGAGVISAFDSRTADTSSLEHLGGLLQSSTYLSGLSGGSWVIGSLYANNFTTVEAIVKPNQESSSPLWQLDNSIVQGPPQDDKVLSAARYWQDLLDTVTAKADAGFNTSITDYWGRGLSFQLISAVDGGPCMAQSCQGLPRNADLL